MQASPTPVIEFWLVTKLFAGRPAVHDVSFSVHSGEIFGFLGPNGAGKSTTIRLMLDILRPNAGQINLFGHDSRSAVAARRRIGYLSGEMVLDSNLTGDQYLRFAAAQYGKDCQEYRRKLAADLQADLGRRIGTYSRGNRQKIGLIAALQHEPELLVLDEPTSGFDPLVQETFVELVRAFQAKGGTVFMSSHILSEVQQLCGRVAFIKEGRVATVTDVGSLTEQAAKRVRVKTPIGEQADLRNRLKKLPGVSLRPAIEDYAVECSYGGDLQALLQLLALYHVRDIRIEEPDLEEVFMQFYAAAKPKTKPQPEPAT